VLIIGTKDLPERKEMKLPLPILKTGKFFCGIMREGGTNERV